MEAIAKHDFSATADDELSFRKTQTLKVSEPSKSADLFIGEWGVAGRVCMHNSLQNYARAGGAGRCLNPHTTKSQTDSVTKGRLEAVQRCIQVESRMARKPSSQGLPPMTHDRSTNTLDTNRRIIHPRLEVSTATSAYS